MFARLFRSLFAARPNRRARRSLLGVEGLEGRWTPTVSAASITSVTSTADTDGIATDAHVKILQGSNAPVVVNFSYTSTQTATATATIANNPAADVTGTTPGLPSGTHTGSISLDVSGLSVGSHNLKLVVDDPAPGSKSDNDSGGVVVYATVTVSLNVNAADVTYTGLPYAGPVNVHVNPHDAAGTTTLTYYAADDLGTPLAGPPTDAGNYRVVAHFASADPTAYTDADGYDDFTIAKADAVVHVSGYTGVYDGQYHGATGTVAGVAADPAAAGSSLDLGASFKDVPGGTAHWVFTGGTNYNDQEGDVAVVITPKPLSADSALTQSSLNVAKDGSVVVRVDVDETGIVDGQSVAALFDGASFTLSVGGNAYTVQARAAVVDGVVQVSFQMSPSLKALLAAQTTATSAKNAPVVGLEVQATSADGNYTLDATAWTRLFSTAK